MKVICIDSGNRYNEDPHPAGWTLVCGETYTVIEECTGYDCYDDPIPCYALLEDPCNDDEVHDVDRFVRVSDIDETEMNRNYSTTKIPELQP